MLKLTFKIRALMAFILLPFIAVALVLRLVKSIVQILFDTLEVVLILLSSVSTQFESHVITRSKKLIIKLTTNHHD
jgi:hypothetical protein